MCVHLCVHNTCYKGRNKYSSRERGSLSFRYTHREDFCMERCKGRLKHSSHGHTMEERGSGSGAARVRLQRPVVMQGTDRYLDLGSTREQDKGQIGDTLPVPPNFCFSSTVTVFTPRRPPGNPTISKPEVLRWHHLHLCSYTPTPSIYHSLSQTCPELAVK